MNVSTSKATLTLAHNLVLYRKALHPELFQVRARKAMSHGPYEFESWLFNGGHMLRFQLGRFVACELLTDRDGGLPLTGAVSSFPCIGEKDYEHAFAAEGVVYITTMQTETLSENLYRATYEEMLAFAQETDGLLVKWTSNEGGKNLSLLDLQRYGKEVHAQSYHLFAQGGTVLRTQTIFEIK